MTRLYSCSLICFRPHKEAHENGTIATPTEHPLPAKPAESIEAQTPAPPLSSISLFHALLGSTELSELFTRHPTLELQLQSIYSATVEPSPDTPQPFKYIKGGEGRFRGRHRNRQKGPWSQKSADGDALRLISQARTDIKGLNQNGMKEFIRLVNLRCGPKEDTRAGAQEP